MKNVLLGIFMLVFASAEAQEMNTVIFDKDVNRDILIGWVDREGTISQDFLGNEKVKYDSYSPNAEAIEDIKHAFEVNKDLNILVVFATWCGDSKMHVPEFYKVADLAGVSRIKYLTVNRKKNAGDIDMTKMNIERVPTFIVYDGETEIGRIVESPEYTLESDLATILKK